MTNTNVYISGNGSMMRVSGSDDTTPEVTVDMSCRSITVDGRELIQAILKCMNLEVEICEKYRH